MERMLGRYEGEIVSLMRVVVGFLFACHGAQKIFGLFGGGPPELTATLWLAGVIELGGGFLVMIGLFTSPAAFVASGLMAGAYFTVHQPQALFPIVNKGEMAALYCWIFLFLAARGGGPWSFDAARKR